MTDTPDTSEWTEARHRATWAVLDVLKRRGTTVTVQAAIAVVDAVARELADDQADDKPLHPVRVVVEKWRRGIPAGALSEAGQLLDDVEAALEQVEAALGGPDAGVTAATSPG